MSDHRATLPPPCHLRRQILMFRPLARCPRGHSRGVCLSPCLSSPDRLRPGSAMVVPRRHRRTMRGVYSSMVSSCSMFCFVLCFNYGQNPPQSKPYTITPPPSPRSSTSRQEMSLLSLKFQTTAGGAENYLMRIDGSQVAMSSRAISFACSRRLSGSTQARYFILCLFRLVRRRSHQALGTSSRSLGGV